MTELFKVDLKAYNPGNQLIQGLTKREYFAAMAMQALLAKGYNNGNTQLGVDSVRYADELIRALNDKDNPNLQP